MNMTKRNRQAVTDARQEKRARSSRQEQQAPKYQEENRNRIIPLVAKSNNQKHALRAFVEKQCIILSGSAGSGKTTLAIWYACKMFLEGKIDNIILTRGEKGLGATPAVPGNDTEKMLTMCLPMLLKMKQFLGAGKLRSNLKMEHLDFLFSEVSGFMVVPMAKLGGMSFDSRTIIIADEQQASTVAQMKALCTRAESGCQVIICGDTTQSPDKGEQNGLEYIERVLLLNPYEGSAVIKFTPDDNCREGFTDHVTRLFEKDGVW